MRLLTHASQPPPIRVLLVEDDEDDFVLVRDTLRSLGPGRMVLEWVAHPEQALAALETFHPDVCLLDYRLGATTGLELLGLARQRGWQGPVILLTGQEDDELDHQALEAGATDFLEKSQLTPTALARSIRYARQHARTLEALRRSQASFRELIERLPDGIGVLDKERLLYATPPLVTLLGCASADELMGRPLAELEAAFVPPEDRDSLPRLRATRSTVPWEMLLLSRGGHRIPVECTWFPVVFEGQPCRVLLVRDLTEHKQLQARLMLADRMASLGTLAAGIAHEINNPLAFTLSNLGHLEEEVLPRLELPAGEQEELHKLLSDAMLGATRVRDIVRQLKMFSRAEEQVRAEPVDVHRVLESVIGMAWNELRHRARLVRDYSERSFVDADEGRLGQVFLNLIVNAAQAIPEGHVERNELRIVTRRLAGEVVVEVRDTGAGMPAEHLARVFEPFFTTKPVGMGTGLGLSICHGIITRSGGRMEVESEQGRGSTFRVILPAATSSQRAATPPAAPVRSVAPRRGRLLVVDDEPMIGMAIRRMLQREHEVVALTSAREALARILGGEHFDVILCDVMMPEMSGMELHEELTRCAPGLADRMVFLTGGAFTPQAREFLARVKNPQREKPFSSQELRELVHGLLTER
ncbi:MAG TPA: response regulator [Myxococcaceae bacterium]|nr:response regulator [Myxococcaceae bacterium]